MSTAAAPRGATASEWLWTVLPVVVMGLLAAWSFWLVRSTPSDSGASPSLVPSQQPDMVLKDFVLQSYDANGALTSELQGVNGWHHPSDDSMVVEQARLRTLGHAQTQAAQWVTAQSNTLWVNGDQTQFKLSGNAQVNKAYSEEPSRDLTFRGEELFIDDGAQWVSSSEPVTITQGIQTMQGNSMRYDQAQGVLNLRGAVRVVRQPSREGRQR